MLGVAENQMALSRITPVLFLSPFFAVTLSPAQLFTSNDISAEATAPVQHGSSLVELDDRSLLVSWYAGTAEAAADTRVLVRRSRTGGTSWEPTQTAVLPHECAVESWLSNKAVGNTALFRDRHNIIWLFYGAVEFGGWSGAHIDYKISRDSGQTWSESHRLTDGLGDLPRSKPIELGSDHIFLPFSHSAVRRYCGGIEAQISDGQIAKMVRWSIENRWLSHPTFVGINPNRVLAFLRARGGGKLQSATFDLRKNVWSKPQPTNLPNPDSGVDAIRLGDGRILLAYNDNAAARNPLSIAISGDGITFRKLRDIENDPGQEFSYPSLVSAKDGTFYLSYTWHHSVAIKCAHFDAAWLGLSGLSETR